MHRLLENQNGMVIAPAGFGKTYFIADCVSKIEGRQLILTHTHAGVASLKEKFSELKVPSAKYNVETISGFVQRFALAFYSGEDVPDISSSGKRFNFLTDKATELFEREPIKKVLRASYQGIFVDEYQDCTQRQHKLILKLAEELPTRILGDPMQSIFGFKGEISVDLNCPIEMEPFISNRHELNEPRRWTKSGNDKLGDEIRQIRYLLERKEVIDFRNFQSISLIEGKHEELFQNIENTETEKEENSPQNKQLNKILKDNNVLVIHSQSIGTKPRLRVMQRFPQIKHLVEAIDDKTFYNVGKEIDCIEPDKLLSGLKSVLKNCEVNLHSILFTQTGGISKSKKSLEIGQAKLDKIGELSSSANEENKLDHLNKIILIIKQFSTFECRRKEVLRSMQMAIEAAIENKTTVFEEMENTRNRLRRAGRNIRGRVIGTTLLTKGLECENVVVLSAEKFTDPKNFYVAISRATSELTIFSETPVLRPYKT